MAWLESQLANGICGSEHFQILKKQFSTLLVISIVKVKIRDQVLIWLPLACNEVISWIVYVSPPDGNSAVAVVVCMPLISIRNDIEPLDACLARW